MTYQEAKIKAIQYNDNGNWFKLAFLILQFGRELLDFIKEYRKSKKQNLQP